MLTQCEVHEFEQTGFLHVPGVLSASELNGLRAATEHLVTNKDQLPPDWQEDFKYGSILGDNVGVGRDLCRIEYTCHKDERFLLALGNPRILGIAASLHGGPIVVTWEDMVVKTPGSGFAVVWHQDSLWQSSYVFSIGIYLDDADQDALRIIPGTHTLGVLSGDEIDEIVSGRADDIVRVPVEAGDAIVHNVRAVHGSPPNESPNLRRTLYFEFRTVDQVLHDSPWDGVWLERRLKLIPYALACRSRSPLATMDPGAERDALFASRDRWLPAVEDAPISVRPQLRVFHPPARIHELSD
jgi:phytanoyl-CoA hydroxylase